MLKCCLSSSGAGSVGDPGTKTERVQELKDKMQAELQSVWTEQTDQMKKKKEQFATEVGLCAHRLAFLLHQTSASIW